MTPDHHVYLACTSTDAIAYSTAKKVIEHYKNCPSQNKKYRYIFFGEELMEFRYIPTEKLITELNKNMLLTFHGMYDYVSIAKLKVA